MLTVVAPWWAGLTYITVIGITFTTTYAVTCHTTMWVWNRLKVKKD